MLPLNSVSNTSLQSASSEKFVRDGQSLNTESSQSTSQSSDSELRTAFHDFVGQTFFSEMLKAFRSTQQNSAYFHGGRAEEIFQGQLDQVLTEKLSESSADKIADPMFELFQQARPQ